VTAVSEPMFLVAQKDCGCISAVIVEHLAEKAEMRGFAAKHWEKRLTHMPESEFRLLPLRCPQHPRVQSPVQEGLGLS